MEGGRGGGVLDLLALLAFFPSVISSFLAEIKVGDPGPSPRSATVMQSTWCDALFVQAVADCQNVAIHVIESHENFAGEL